MWNTILGFLNFQISKSLLGPPGFRWILFRTFTCKIFPFVAASADPAPTNRNSEPLAGKSDKDRLDTTGSPFRESYCAGGGCVFQGLRPSQTEVLRSRFPERHQGPDRTNLGQLFRRPGRLQHGQASENTSW